MSEPQMTILYPVSPEDICTLFRWINDRETVLFNAPYKPVSWAQHQKWFSEIQECKDVVLFGIYLTESKEMIGTCQLNSIHNVARSAELQIRIGDDNHRGQGYGYSSLIQLLRYGFKDLNLNRIYLHVFADNARAINLYEKAGFVREGLLRNAAYIDGKYVDLVVMGLLREEFPKP